MISRNGCRPLRDHPLKVFLWSYSRFKKYYAFHQLHYDSLYHTGAGKLTAIRYIPAFWAASNLARKWRTIHLHVYAKKTNVRFQKSLLNLPGWQFRRMLVVAHPNCEQSTHTHMQKPNVRFSKGSLNLLKWFLKRTPVYSTSTLRIVDAHAYAKKRACVSRRAFSICQGRFSYYHVGHIKQTNHLSRHSTAVSQTNTRFWHIHIANTLPDRAISQTVGTITLPNRVLIFNRTSSMYRTWLWNGVTVSHTAQLFYEHDTILTHLDEVESLMEILI